MTNSKLSFNLMCESFEPLSAEEQISFFRLAKEGDDKSRERLILSNLRLVVSIARRYSTVSLSVSYDDLIQSGFMGILKALDTYSCDFGTKFSTHAAYWIKKEILKVLRNAGRPINFPEHFSDSLRRFITAKKTLLEEYGRELSLEELSEALNLSIRQIKDFESFSYVYLSLNDPDSFLENTVFSNDCSIDYLTLKQDIKRLLLVLNEREREIIMRRFALEPYKEKELLKDIAISLKLSMETVRLTEKKALSKLKAYLEAEGLTLTSFM